MLTIETFSPDNRDRRIGNSLYRICADDTREIQKPTLWHIHECYNNQETGEWARARGFYTTKLQEAIDTINSFTKEKEVINRERR